MAQKANEAGMNNHFDRVYKKLDSVNDKLSKISETTAKQEQHLKDMNGTIARHESQFKDLYQKTDANTNGLSQLRGGGIAVGVVLTILSIIAVSKSIGLW